MIMNHFNLVFEFLLLSRLLNVTYGKLSISIYPSDDPVIRYVGENLTLTCRILNTTIVDGHNEGAFVPVEEIKDEHSVSINWIIPTNAEDRIEIRTHKGIETVKVFNLKETDAGKYTCNLVDAFSQENTKKDSVSVVVRPRGLASQCTPNSFACNVGICIPQRYKCDGVPDCPDNSDETVQNCGLEKCKNKLACEDRRCMDKSVCCREPNLSPSNCTIRANIKCCRQLIHPALLDMDLFYLATEGNVKSNWEIKLDSAIWIGSAVILANIFTVTVVLAIKYHLWKTGRITRNQNWNPFPSDPNRSLHDHNQLTSRNQSLGRLERFYTGSHLSARDLLSAEFVRANQNRGRGLVLLPLSTSQADCDPPPSYHQVVGAPPPPYSTTDHAISPTIPLLAGLESEQTVFSSPVNPIPLQQPLPNQDRNNHPMQYSSRVGDPTTAAVFGRTDHVSSQVANNVGRLLK